MGYHGRQEWRIQDGGKVENKEDKEDRNGRNGCPRPPRHPHLQSMYVLHMRRQAAYTEHFVFIARSAGTDQS